MRKKYLSALLFGALLVTSAGTFTSCKDYDDEINDLQTQITDVKTALAELQKAVEAGKYVSDIVADGTGLKITWNDGSSTVIANLINEEVTPGSVVTINPETGEIIIDDKGTGYFASKNTETEEFKAPYVNEDGVLVLINEEGEEVVTEIRVAPVTAVKNSDGSYTLTVIAADGTKQEITVPSAASVMRDLELMGWIDVNDIDDKGNLSLADIKANDVNTVNQVDKGLWVKYRYI
ncbi:hypothetical protein QVN91_08675 [Bacteroides caecigallinarum]|nr:hypothetical protein [Bacteroides caecigallinarum]